MIARRPAPFLALALLITAFLSLGIVGLRPLGIRGLHADAGVDLLADPGSPRYADQVLFGDSFGTDPIVVMVEAQPGVELVTGNHFIGLAALEGNLADRRISPGVKKVYGPGTVVNTLALEVTRRGLEICAAEAKAAENQAVKDAAGAGKSVKDQQAAGQAAFDAAARSCATTLAARYPGLGIPALNNPAFVRGVLLEPDGTRSRPYWSWALPDPGHALITVRMDPHASLAEVRNVLATVDRARRAPTRPPAGGQGRGAGSAPAATSPGRAVTSEVSTSGDLSDLKLTVTGAPVLAASLADTVQAWLLALLPWTLLVMLLVTILVLRLPMRVLAVPIAGLAAFWTAGAAGWAGLPITPATMAVLPVVLGLATDYVLQTLNRLADEETGGPTGRMVRAARAILPPTGVAALATVAGVMAFAVSPLPLVRQFALFLAIGVAMAYLAAMLVGIPLFSLVMSTELRRFLAGRAVKPVWPVLARVGRLPLALVVPMVVLGIAGWSALPHLDIETDPARLMPAGDAALAQADHVRRAVGLAGEVDLVMVGPAVASPEALRWMEAASVAIAARDPAALHRQTSLPSFLAAFNQGVVPDQTLTQTILQRMPRYFTGAVLNTDRGVSRSVFSLSNLMSVEQDGRIVDHINHLSPPPPDGYRAFAAGLSVVASDALRQMRQDLLPLNLLALVLVFGALVVAFRKMQPALVAVVPTVVAAGWATGLLYLAHVASSPITVLLAGVVVAFATEFSVLWLMRYSAGLRSGVEAAAASAEASTRVGPAIVASALALAGGFAVLSFAPVPMVRDFGLFSGADLLLATAAVLVILPPLARRFVR